MLEPAPGRASTTTCWPSVLLMASPTSRAVISAAEPGGKPMIRPMGRDGWLSAFACGTAATAVSTSVSAKTAMRCMAVLPLDAACVVQRTGYRQTSCFACASRDWRNDLMLIDRKSHGDVACCYTTSVPGLFGGAATEGNRTSRRNRDDPRRCDVVQDRSPLARVAGRGIIVPRQTRSAHLHRPWRANLRRGTLRQRLVNNDLRGRAARLAFRSRGQDPGQDRDSLHFRSAKGQGHWKGIGRNCRTDF